jgi:hypothetical protein
MAMKVSTATLILCALACVLVASPAFAQGQTKNWAQDPRQEEDLKEQKKTAKEIEKEYNAVVKRTNSQTTSAASDPWANIRPSSPEKAKQ